MAWNDGLEGKGLEIAASKSKIIKVEAGPGTGKSFAMKRRVARLLEAKVNPENILAVTFTRNAASALLSDLHGLSIKGCDELRVGTLHSLCFSILMKNAVFKYLNRVPRPLITVSRYGVLQYQGYPLLQDLDNPSKFGTKRDKTKRIKAFEAAWARLQSEQPGWPKSTIDREFQSALVAWLTFHRSMLIGEVVPLTLRYLKNNPTADELKEFEYIIVDEYQDLNRAEQDLIDVLGKKSSIAVVGDPDQSIYSFRHAHPDGIREFAVNHPGTDKKDLDECRRCPTAIVEIANELIMTNHPARTSRRLNPMRGNPFGTVHIVQWNDLDEETKGITRYVKKLIEAGKYEAKDFLILCTRRQIGYAIRDSLLQKGITAHSFFNEESLESEEAQRSFTLLALLTDNEDRVALRFWLGYGSNTWLENEYRILRKYCEANEISPWETLNLVHENDLTLKGIARLAKRFNSLLSQLEKLKESKASELVDALFPKSKEWATLLRDAALIDLDPESSPKQLYEKLRIAITQPEVPDSPDFVRVMSLHKSKGLSSPVTIVAGSIQGIMPLLLDEGSDQEKAASLKEQRRVFYVAITRATEVLVVSSVRYLKRDLAHKMGAKVKPGTGSYGAVISSQFISELGPAAPSVQGGLVWQRKGYI